MVGSCLRCFMLWLICYWSFLLSLSWAFIVIFFFHYKFYNVSLNVIVGLESFSH